jgi:signal transduction histidine kinase
VAGLETGRAASLTAGGDNARAFFPAEPLLDALTATAADGQARCVHLGRVTDRTIDVSIRRDANGKLLVGLSYDMVGDSEPLRRLARQLAAETDTDAILGILCVAACRECDANGAGVLKAVANEGELVVATGPLAVARGRRFALPGSLAREVIRKRDVVCVDDFGAKAWPLAQVVPDLRVGPMLLGPLIARNVILGVLVVTRDPGAQPFSTREAHCVRVITDYAALALWKAELLDQAQAADRAKSRFLATVSHELRTPLTALAGYGELLADEVIGPLSESQLDVLERMRSVTSHLAAVIEEVLAFSSLDEGRERIRPTDFLAADLIQAVAAVVEPLAHQKRLAFALDVPDTPIRMTSDIDKIRQILVNLAGNAVKFTDVGEVRLELRVLNGEVYFSVCDTGIGIGNDDRARLFKPFAQLDTGLTRRHGGTGLGLYISRSLAELLGGRIEVTSKLGRGSTFTLVLPTDDQTTMTGDARPSPA